MRSLPATFVRGGTSKALIFSAAVMPSDRKQWDEIFLQAMGSPDSYGRQLNGMGGGVSSLSKVAVVGPSQHPGADVDYTFGQVLIKEARVDYKGNCGNISSAVGPWAVENGLVQATGNEARVRIFNTNTGKIIESIFPIKNGKPVYEGDLAIPGVSDTGASVRLNFLEPGGATTGTLLPTGNLKETLQAPGIGPVEVSMIDAANACVFVEAGQVGLRGGELPQELSAKTLLLEKLDLIRRTASLAMGISKTLDEAMTIVTVPYIAIVSRPQDFQDLEGQTVSAQEQDLCVRVIASGQPHQALPLTVSLCTAVAARMRGSLVADVLGEGVSQGRPLRLGMPSGILTVDADVANASGNWRVASGGFYRTTRPLFVGHVLY
ncbi:MAG TPA: PrpF domain-containing protein [Bdellovibrio sp.]